MSTLNTCNLCEGTGRYGDGKHDESSGRFIECPGCDGGNRPRLSSPVTTADALRTDSHRDRSADVAGSPVLLQLVSEVLPGSLEFEHELHIEDAHYQYRTAYERFEQHGLPQDRDEALLHLHRMNTAILGRSPAVQAQRHAEFERQLDESTFSGNWVVPMAQLGRAGGLCG